MAASSVAKNVLMILTSHDKLGDFDEQTGWYLPEVAHPYDEFKAAGISMVFASPKGGVAPVDEGSVDASKEDASCMSFIAEGSETKALVENTKKLSEVTDLSSFDAVFFAGGFGTMWDFPDDADVHRIVKEMWEAGKIVSAVCHGPCALSNVKLSDGTYLVEGKTVAAFTNAEEDAVSRRNKIPFTCEDRFNERGAKYTQGGVFEAHVAVDGKLITGQNPPSAKPTAEAVIAALA
mmetsp:Transcript_50871/g.65140  ORF Transcript_50871/g.65140 Transcript_50871/m.65140 type:complete len:235 (+) Transcript_50871:71-775(+)|eukprot:CAMPEP_0114343152 /NCGR_PEP_ID=MMETSP0101-20121206/10372_1 /TAXON_ID=38822 ORGANISM="Pteridomonas danica, Strain PT" /NCGR_SAMPLE_ID=MMETSP0101 /ASSEMBLY_ACC=CAM_ASM_000211 /LENGTH=234 /DNA_ID=CAMNT_0001477691 /DNA_START=61 /DNA_END=765 /DNA_ORIENTATION=+